MLPNKSGVGSSPSEPFHAEHLEQKAVDGQMPVTLEDLGVALIPRGIDSEELVEALEWLLEQGSIIEVEQNEFILD